MTATVLTDEMRATIETTILPTLGEYPHGAIIAGSRAGTVQTTRMLKIWCPESKYAVRMTQKWLDLYGPPTCPCHQDEMEEAS